MDVSSSTASVLLIFTGCLSQLRLAAEVTLAQGCAHQILRGANGSTHTQGTNDTKGWSNIQGIYDFIPHI